MGVTFWLGVVAMFGSLLILLVLPITDISRIRGNQFRPLMKLAAKVGVFDYASEKPTMNTDRLPSIPLRTDLPE